MYIWTYGYGRVILLYIFRDHETTNVCGNVFGRITVTRNPIDIREKKINNFFITIALYTETYSWYDRLQLFKFLHNRTLFYQ